MRHCCNILGIALTIFLVGCTSLSKSVPTIDGVISAQEWNGSQSFAMSGGGRVRILIFGNRLYIAVSGQAPGFPTIFVASQRFIEVLHASAAQGMIRYGHSDGMWHATTTEFDFELRENASGKQPSKQIRSVYLERNGWISTSSKENAKDREFRIDLQPDQKFIAVAFLEVPSFQVSTWPTQLDDGTSNKELLRGEVPDTLRFDTLKWHVIGH